MKGTESDPTLLDARDVAHVASCVGHHVINAFAAVVSNAELLRLALENRAALDKEGLTATIIRSALDASDVARRLIDYSRPMTTPGLGSVRLDAFLDDYFRNRAAASPGSTAIRWRTELSEVPVVPGNADHLHDMLDRLVENSIEAVAGMPEAEIGVRLSMDERGWVDLELYDTGGGMPPAVLERAVEPFFSTKPGHIGVGLSIANRIWRRHRGTLAIRSDPGDGTRIRLRVDAQRPTEFPSDQRPAARQARNEPES